MRPKAALGDVTTPPLLFTGAPGVPFAIPIPDECGFVGVAVCTQGAAVGAAGAIQLTNALDLVLGSP